MILVKELVLIYIIAYKKHLTQKNYRLIGIRNNIILI
jgi:hypothetical protein